MPDRPVPGSLEQRSAPVEGTAPTVSGNRLHGLVPFGVESRDLGGWTEVLAPGCLANADRSRLVVNVDHGGLPLGRFPATLTLEDRDDGLAWSVELPQSRADVREAIERGDLDATSWRMVVGRDSWEGSRRTVHEIRALHDVAIVVNAAYPTHAELRAAPAPSPDPAPAAPAPEPLQEATVPEGSTAGGLQLEDRAAIDQPTIETRVADAIRGVTQGEVRSLSTSSADAIAPPELATFIWDRMRPASIALESGIRVITTDRESIEWPRIISDVDPSWTAELDVIPESDPAFGSITATPKKLATRQIISNELLDDSEPSVLEVLQTHVAVKLAEKLDLAIFIGNPSAVPESIRGMKYVAGIQSLSMGANGGPLTDYDALIEAIGMLRGANVAPPYEIAMHPRAHTALELLRESTDSNLQLGAPAGIPQPRTSTALPVNETKGTATNASSIYVYAANEIVLVRRADATLELDRSRLFHQDASELRSKLRADLVVPNPQSIVRIEGVIPAA